MEETVLETVAARSLACSPSHTPWVVLSMYHKMTFCHKGATLVSFMPYEHNPSLTVPEQLQRHEFTCYVSSCCFTTACSADLQQVTTGCSRLQLLLCLAPQQLTAIPARIHS